MSENKNKNETSLQKKLSPLNVWALAFGCIIGWGSFMMPGTTFLPKAGPMGTVVAMAIGAMIMIVIAFSYGYMVPKYPKAGGEFTFTKEVFGSKNAFVCAWFLALAYVTNVPMNSTALGLMTRKLFFGVFQFGKMYSVAGYDIYFGEVALAIFAMVIIAVLNIYGVKKAGWVQTFMAFTLVTAFLIIAISALFSPVTDWSNFKPMWGANPNSSASEIISGIIAIVAVAPWAFVGFDTIPQASEEFNFSHKKVNIIMIIAILFGMVVYSSNTLVTAAASPDWVEFISKHDWAVGAAVEALMGKTGLVILGFAVTSAILTGMLGFLAATSRLLYSMSREGYLPKFFGKVHSKYGTPVNAIVFCLVFSIIGPWFGRTALGWFVDMSAIGGAIGFGYTTASAFITLKKAGELKSRLSLTISTLVGTLFSVLFIILLLVPSFPGAFSVPSYIMFFIWILLGLLFYILKRRQNIR